MSSPYYRTAHWKALRLACLERDGYRCAVAGCHEAARVADHIETRPQDPQPCSADRLDNLRSLCLSHDAQVKERRRGIAQRKQGGVFRLKGCDANGWPLSPAHNR